MKYLIKNINVVGNSSFDDEEILKDFELKTGGWFSFFEGAHYFDATNGTVGRFKGFKSGHGLDNTLDVPRVACHDLTR